MECAGQAHLILNLIQNDMDIIMLRARHWEDVVFADRNKAYGAYQLRRNYSRRVITGWGISVAVFASLLWWAQQCESPPTARIKAPDLPLGPSLPPIIERSKPRKESARRPQARRANTNVQVTTDEVVLQIDEVSMEPVSLMDDGTTSDIGSADGIGVAPIEVPAEVVVTSTVNIAQVMPEYIGGESEMMKFITRKIRYPKSARHFGYEGTVFVRFVVMADGSVSEVEVVRGFHPDCDKEAVRVIRMMPKWIGGSQNGSPVNVRMVLPIKFKIS